MRLSLSEIRANAMKFATEWTDVSSERAEAQTFWTDLFSVFGIRRRSVASFEEKVRNLGGAFDRIDVLRRRHDRRAQEPRREPFEGRQPGL